MHPSPLDDFRLPGDQWRPRLILLMVVSAACVGMLLTWPPGTPTTSASQRSANPTVTAATTSTTVDPKAISAGVAALYAHEGPTSQQLVSAPSSPRSTHHARVGGGRSRR